jgi:photosystem II stability/assembly factor-like uncharacterized protein
MNLKIYLYGILFILVFFSQSNVQAQQWVLAGSVPQPGLQPTISVVNGNDVWIAGGPAGTPKVYRTTNGGMNWLEVPISGPTVELNCLWAISPTNVFTGEGGNLSGGARMFNTTDAGQTWTAVLQTNPNQGYFNGIIFSKKNGNRGYGIALAERIYKTSNYGFNWFMQQSGVNGVSNAHNSLFVIDFDFYGFGMNNGAARIRITTNAGAGWNNYTVNLLGDYTSGISFYDNKLMGLSATSISMPFISKTLDGGITWTPIDIGPGVTGNCFIKWIPESPIVYILGLNGGIKRSLDNGQTWAITPIPPGVTDVYHFDFERQNNNEIYGYAVARNGTVIKLLDSIIIITGNFSKHSEIPDEFKLEQNYPNPFNPFTKIKYSIPNTAVGKVHVNLSVFNIIGENVSTLVDEEQGSGEYELEFNGNNLASGMYFYRFVAGDEFTDVKRMMLVK